MMHGIANLSAATAPSGYNVPQPLGVGGTWLTVFYDDFNGTELDSNKWLAQRGMPNGPFSDPANVNEETAAYLQERVTVHDGMCELFAKRGDFTTSKGTYHFTSGIIQTPTILFGDGFFEARIRVPRHPGYWPAFWMARPDYDANNSAEIDIAEFFPPTQGDQFLAAFFNAHYGTYSPLSVTSYGLHNYDYINDDGKFHTYGMLRKDGGVTIFYDGVKVREVEDFKVPSDRLMLILNLAVRKVEDLRMLPEEDSMLIDHVGSWISV